MKKALLLLVAFALTMAASGRQLTKSPLLSGPEVKGKYEFRTTHKSAERGGKLPLVQQSRKAPARVDIISEQPEGELKTYQRSGGAIYNMWGYIFSTYQDGGAMQMVFADDGKTVYLKDPISQAVANTWVRAELSDDGKTLTMPLNQFITYFDEVEYGLMTAWVDGSGIGLIYDDDLTWAGYVDWESVYTPFDATPVELPEGIVMEDFSMSYVDSYGNANGKMVKVGIMDNDVYVQGFSSLVPEGVMKGSLNGDKVIFESDQYLGVGSSLFLNMMGLDAEYTILDNLEFDYEAETRTMTASNILAVVAGMNIQEEYDQPS